MYGKNFLRFVPYILIAVLLISTAIFYYRTHSLLEENQRLEYEISVSYNEKASLLKEFQVVKTKLQSTNQILKQKELHSATLLAKLEELQKKKQQVRYVINQKTILKSSEEEVTASIPDHYLFQLDNELVVASIDKEEEQYKLKTYDLSIKNEIALTQREAHVNTKIASSYNPNQWYDAEAETVVYNVSDRSLFFKPELGLLAGYNSQLSMFGGLYLSLMHPSDSVDVLSLQIGASKDTALIGIAPVSYNFGKNLPLLEDVWFVPSINIHSNATNSIGIAIGSKL